jgi:hypothetical protein
MKKALRTVSIGLILAVLAIPLSGCFTGYKVTPDLTLTALFAPNQANPTFPPTWTPEGTQPTLGPTTPAATPTGNQTNSPTPTATATITVTSAPLPARYGPWAYAYYQSSAPAIDGNWGEWIDNTVNYPIESLVYEGTHWAGNDDLSGSYILGWNNTYLFVGVKAHDDKYVQNATGDGIYEGDSIELLIDTDLYGDFYTAGLTRDDYQLGISPGNPTAGNNPEAFLWYPRALTGGESSVKIAAYYVDGIDRIEFRIPWSVLGVSPYYGLAMGFAISLSDNDNTSENVQQKMMSNDPFRHLTDPTTWGEMILR